MRSLRIMFLLAGTSVFSHAFEIGDFALHVSLSDPQVSPDEKHVAYVRMSATESLRYQFEIVLLDLVSGSRRTLTEASQFAHHPRWISATKVSFLAVTPDAGNQVFVTDLDTDETRQVTHHIHGLQGFTWHPESTQLVFASREKKAASPVRAYEVTKFSISPPAEPQSVFLMDASSGEARKLEGARPIVNRWSRIHWSPDGERLLYMQKNPAHYDEYSNFIVEYNIAANAERTLTNGAYPQYAPDGDRVLFLARETIDYAVGPRKAYLLQRSTGNIARVAPGLDRETLGRYLPNGQVLLNGPELDAQKLWIADTTRAQPLDLEGVEPTWPLQASRVGDTFVLVGATSAASQELYLHGGEGVRAITMENTLLSEDRDRGTVRSIRWQTPDGLSVGGLALLPPDYEPGKRYPLVVTPHGGPHTTVTVAGMANNLINQTMASRGWIVFSPNFRGSTNQGREFHLMRLDNATYDRDVVIDVMSGITALESECRCVDSARQALVGTSYGGKVAAWVTALHPDVWAASVVGNASLDDIDMYIMSDRGVGFARKYGGPPWTAALNERYRQASPVYIADKIRTPTLILSTLEDPRVPVNQSFKFWRALEDNGVEVEFVAYDMKGHGPSDLANSMDYWQRAIDWVEKHFERDNR